ncbi:MAG: hypothetical protein ACFFCM_07810 [Promethearchaeota archaeon]
MICLTCGEEFGRKRKFNFVRECDKCKLKNKQTKAIEINSMVSV